MEDIRHTIYAGDCWNEIQKLCDQSIDSIVTDPPYGLEFMGKEWDHGVPAKDFWIEALRVAKPGCHLLAFGGTRTYHRLAVAIEDAGWEIRDCIMWVYGSGFPKSHDVSKAIDKAAGAEREVGEVDPARAGRLVNQQCEYQTSSGWSAGGRKITIDPPATDDAKKWNGWGTALKPAWEPIIVARKPLVGTVAENVLKHGTGGINIDGCRVETEDDLNGGAYTKNETVRNDGWGYQRGGAGEYKQPTGRFPANFIHDGSEEVLQLFPFSKDGEVCGRSGGNGYGGGWGAQPDFRKTYGGSGSAARFFYCAKASRSDREDGLESDIGTLQQSVAFGQRKHGTLPYTKEIREQNPRPRVNTHPTVKPTDLMRYLCRLVTPPNGIVLDPFMGSGSTGKAAMLEGFRFVGIEREASYVEIAKARIASAMEKRTKSTAHPTLFSETTP